MCKNRVVADPIQGRIATAWNEGYWQHGTVTSRHYAMGHRDRRPCIHRHISTTPYCYYQHRSKATAVRLPPWPDSYPRLERQAPTLFVNNVEVNVARHGRGLPGYGGAGEYVTRATTYLVNQC